MAYLVALWVLVRYIKRIYHIYINYIGIYELYTTFAVHLYKTYIPMSNKKFLLELTEEEAQQLSNLAEQHGNKFKPFAEYLLRLQLGTVPLPTAAPVQIPVKSELLKGKPEQETNPQEIEDLPKKNTVAHIRKGEVIEQHKQGRYLQRKWHPLGIMSNGESLRVSTDKGFKYAYFAEDLEQYLEEPF